MNSNDKTTDRGSATLKLSGCRGAEAGGTAEGLTGGMGKHRQLIAGLLYLIPKRYSSRWIHSFFP